MGLALKLLMFSKVFSSSREDNVLRRWTVCYPDRSLKYLSHELTFDPCEITTS